MIQLFKYVGKEEGSRKGPKWGRRPPGEALGSRTPSTSEQNVIREPEVNTPQNPDRTTNPTIMNHDEACSTIETESKILSARSNPISRNNKSIRTPTYSMLARTN